MDLDISLPWLALHLTRGLGSRLTGRLLRQFGSPEAVFNASLTELEACRLPAATAQAVKSRAGFREAEQELVEARRIGCGLLHWQEPEYPHRLLEIYDPPPLLYVRGDAQVLRRHSIALVGTRRPTPYGNQIAERVARDLAERGLVIVSGLARGIDSSAHHGACAAPGGCTVGVLGCGVDVVYPKENRKLFAEVERCGAIISEFPLGSHPSPDNFPVRAKLVTGWEDVVEELPTEIRAELFPVDATTAEERASLFEQALSPAEKKLYELLRWEEATHVDDLVERTGLSSSETLASLCELEMRGIIRQMPGKQFVKVLL